MWVYLFPAFSFRTQFLKPTLWNYVKKKYDVCHCVCAPYELTHTYLLKQLWLFACSFPEFPNWKVLCYKLLWQ